MGLNNLPSPAQLACYTEEVAAIKRFLIKPKNTFQWQDWLKLVKPEQRAFTVRLSASACQLDDPIFGKGSRYTNLLNMLCATGVIEAVWTTLGTRVYTWVGFPLRGELTKLSLPPTIHET